MHIQCPVCSAILRAPSSSADQPIQCLSCRKVFQLSAAPVVSLSRVSAVPQPAMQQSPASDSPSSSAPGTETVEDPNQTGPFQDTPSVSGAQPGSPPSPPPIAGYEILGILGQGGMGVVYKARQTGLNRLVALKMIRGGAHAGSAELARFQAEAEAVARLQHPGIVQIHDIGWHDQLPYFSLELVEGSTLQQRLRELPLPAQDAAQLLAQMAQAIEAAHQAGVVHRDLKPGNVLLTPEQQPKITDFGLAKHLEEDSGQTQTGQVMGTPAYMAPEQARGHIHLIGPATDVYALGAILYECLTGRPPFRGASVQETLDQVCRREPVSPRQLQPQLPRDLETICLKCLHKEAKARYATARDLGDDLQRFLEGRPIVARPVGRLEKGWRWCRRNPVVAGLSAAMALLVIAAFIIGSVALVRIHNDRNEIARQKGELGNKTVELENQATELKATIEEKNQALAKERAALLREKIAFDNSKKQIGRQYNRAGNQIVKDDPDAAILYFTKALEHDSDNPDRAMVHRLRVQSHLRAFTRDSDFWNYEKPIKYFAFSPDSRRLLTIYQAKEDKTSTVAIRDLITGKTVSRPSAPYRYLIRPHPFEDSPPYRRARPLFSPNGSQVCFVDDKHNFGIWDVALQNRLASTEGISTAQRAALLFAAFGQGPIHGPGMDQFLRDIMLQQFAVRNLLRSMQAGQYGPDGRSLVTWGGARWARWKTDQVLPVQKTPWGTRLSTVIESCCPNGRYLIGKQSPPGSGQTEAPLVIIDSKTGKTQKLPVSVTVNRAISVTYDPNGKWLATIGGNEVHLWDLATGKPAIPPLKHHGKVNRIQLSRSGQHLLTLSTRDPEEPLTVTIWNTATGELRCHFEYLGDQVRSAKAALSYLRFDLNDKYLLVKDRLHQALQARSLFTGEVLKDFRSEKISHAALHPHGSSFLTVSEGRDSHPEVRLWTVSSNSSPFGGFPNQSKWSSTLVYVSPAQRNIYEFWADFSPRGKHIVIATREEVRLWHLASQTTQVFRQKSGERLYHDGQSGRGIPAGVLLSPDGNYLTIISEDQKSVHVWETASPGTSSMPGRMANIWFSKDGKRARALMEQSGGQYRIYDPLTTLPVTPAWTPKGRVIQTRFSQDGRRILFVTSANRAAAAPAPPRFSNPRLRVPAPPPEPDRSARVWSAETGKPIGPAIRHRTILTSNIALCPDSSLDLLASLYPNGKMQLWSTRGAPRGDPLTIEGGAREAWFDKAVISGGASAGHSAPILWARNQEGLEQVWTFKQALRLPSNSPYERSRGRSGYGASWREPFVPVTPLMKLNGKPYFTRFTVKDMPLALVRIDDQHVQMWNAITGKPAGPPLSTRAKIVRVEPYPSSSYSLRHARLVTEGGSVQFWDLQKGERLDRFDRLSNQIVNKGSLGSGYTLVVDNTTARFWKSFGTEPLGPELKHDEKITAADRVTFNGKTCALITTGSTVHLWEGKSGRKIFPSIKHDKPVLRAIASGNSGSLLLVASGKKLYLYDGKGTLRSPPLEHGKPIQKLVRASTTLAYTLTDKLTLWSIRTGKRLGAPIALTAVPKHIVLSSTSAADRAALLYEDRAEIWDLKGGKQLGASIQCKDSIWRFYSYSQRLYLLSRKKMWVVSTRTGEQIGKTVQFPDAISRTVLEGHRFLIIATGNEARIYGLGQSTSDPLATLAFSSKILSIQKLSSTSQVLIASENGIVQGYDCYRKVPLFAPVDHGGPLAFVRASFQGKVLITVGKNGAAHVWKLPSSFYSRTKEPLTLERMHTLKLSEKLARLSLSSKGTYLIGSTTDGTMQSWSLGLSGPQSKPWKQGRLLQVYQPSLTPTVDRVVTVGEKEIRLYDPIHREPLSVIAGRDHPIADFQLSADGKLFTTRDPNGTLRVWSTLTGGPASTPYHHARALKEGNYLEKKPVKIARPGIPVFGGPPRNNNRYGSIQLTYHGRNVLFWQEKTHRPIRPPLTMKSDVRTARFLDQTKVLITTKDTVQIHDAASGQDLVPPVSHSQLRGVYFLGTDIEPLRLTRNGLPPDEEPMIGSPHVFSGPFTSGPYPGSSKPKLQPFQLRPFCTVGANNEVRLWAQVTSKDGKRTWGLYGKPLRPRGRLLGVFGTSGNQIFTLSETLIQIWSPRMGILLHNIPVKGKVKQWQFAGQSPPIRLSGQAGFGWGGSARLTLVNAQGLVQQLGLQVPVPFGRPPNPPQRKPVLAIRALRHGMMTASVSRDGSQVLTFGNDGIAQLWDGSTGKMVGAPFRTNSHTIPAGFPQPEEQKVTSVTDMPFPEGPKGAYWHTRESSPEHSLVVRYRLTDQQTHVEIWSLTTKKQISAWTVPGRIDSSFIRFSPDGKLILMRSSQKLSGFYGGGGGGGTGAPETLYKARVWEVATGKPLTPELGKDRMDVTGFSVQGFTPDSRCIVILDRGGARLYDARSGDPVTPIYKWAESNQGPSHPSGIGSVTLSPDGQYLIVHNNVEARTHQLRTKKYTDEQLRALAQVRAYRQMDDTGELFDLHHARLSELKQQLPPRTAEQEEAQIDRLIARQADLLAGAEKREDWRAAIQSATLLIKNQPDQWQHYQKRAELLHKAGLKAQALADYTHLISLARERNPQPQDYLFWYRRGYLHAERGNKEQAIRDYQMALRLRSERGLLTRYYHSLLLLQKQAQQPYANGCKTMLGIYEKTTSPQTAARVAQTLKLAPLPKDLIQRALPLAKKAADSEPTHPVLQDHYLALLHRSGEYQRAVELRKNFLQGKRYTVWDVAQNHLWMAMGYQKLGQTDPAQQHLKSAQSLLSSYGLKLGDEDDRQKRFPWALRAQIRLLQEEAIALIHGKQP